MVGRPTGYSNSDERRKAARREQANRQSTFRRKLEKLLARKLQALDIILASKRDDPRFRDSLEYFARKTLLELLALFERHDAILLRPKNTVGGRPPKVRLRRQSGRKRIYDPETILNLVDEAKGYAAADGRTVGDAQAIGELLYQNAPSAVRAQLDKRLAIHRESAGTLFKQGWGALRKAILHVDITRRRFNSLKTDVSNARSRRRLG